MKKLLLSLILVASVVASFAQSGAQQFSGVFYRVNDTTAYQSAAVGKHSQGYSDIYFNNQATTPHFDIWNGSSYDHVFNWGGGDCPDCVKMDNANYEQAAGSATQTRLTLNSDVGSFLNLKGYNANTNFQLTNDLVQMSTNNGGALTILDVSDSTAVIFSDPRPSPRGIKYNGDYSATFQDESLVTKRYVDAVSGGGVGDVTYADLKTSRTLTSADDLDQSDQFKIVYVESATPFNVTVDALDAGTQIYVVNDGAATVTLIQGSGVTLDGTTIDIEGGKTAVITYKTSTAPSVSVSGTDIVFGTGVETALGVNVGSVGSVVVNGGALGTPSSGTGTNITGIVGTNVTNTPAGNIAATTSQSAINELDTEKVSELLTVAGITLEGNITVTQLLEALAVPGCIPIHADAAVPMTLTDQPNSISPIPNSGSYQYCKINTTNIRRMRLYSRVVTTSASTNNPRIYIQYSINGGSTYVTLGAGTIASGDAISLFTGAAGVQVTNWITVPEEARGDSFIWRVVTDGGNASADPIVGNVFIEFTT